MARDREGFTLIELVVAMAIFGILMSIAIAKYSSVRGRAEESSTKANMHTFQLVTEDQGVQANGKYAVAATVAASLPTTFKNPFDGTTGSGNSWESRSSSAGAPTAKRGLTSYWTDTLTYNVKGYGSTAALALVLTSGQ